MSTNWNELYENQDTPWDKGEAAPPLREFLTRHWIGGHVLVPGCGAGHDVRLLAEQGATVLGFDLAPAAIALAESIEPVGGESYRCGDFLELAEDLIGQFDWVVEHTCLCALEPSMRQAYAQSVLQALKPGGTYLAVFYREIPDYDGDGPPHPIAEEAIESLFGGAFELLERFVPEQSYASRPYGSEEVCLFRKLC
ncbi:methyltransferase domain-containing protein [Coraliomargarita akajimensis]|uniref:Thiopurine S-methyltransferase n=1 Tax=Coraliomargarita akajimensis (strain DSM 45221 / IAM 15411 / JCM 23193 / KCTC 12865 / 04OKA010-24) TaxID=583355 RepID=D5EQF8_CORAD|nr:methyltransferase domain-containing protein [Coraliomargarita akajimensis]ADE55772.1 thiopurine S-methyltransferase [Coraliomargarita akajimensis DSM 45221]